MADTTTDISPTIVEGVWVKDLRSPTDTDRVGQVTVFSEYTPMWAQVKWNERTLETVHDLAVLQPVRGPVGEIEPLEFPPPDCPYDQTSLQHDDGWWCTTCHASWGYNGTNGTRTCLECKTGHADVIDVDGRALCIPCAEYMDSERAADALTEETDHV